MLWEIRIKQIVMPGRKKGWPLRDGEMWVGTRNMPELSNQCGEEVHSRKGEQYEQELHIVKDNWYVGLRSSGWPRGVSRQETEFEIRRWRVFCTHHSRQGMSFSILQAVDHQRGFLSKKSMPQWELLFKKITQGDMEDREQTLPWSHPTQSSWELETKHCGWRGRTEKRY